MLTPRQRELSLNLFFSQWTKTSCKSTIKPVAKDQLKINNSGTTLGTQALVLRVCCWLWTCIFPKQKYKDSFNKFSLLSLLISLNRYFFKILNKRIEECLVSNIRHNDLLTNIGKQTCSGVIIARGRISANNSNIDTVKRSSTTCPLWRFPNHLN